LHPNVRHPIVFSIQNKGDVLTILFQLEKGVLAFHNTTGLTLHVGPPARCTAQGLSTSPTHVSDWVTGPLSLFGPHTNLGPGHLFSPSLAVCAQRRWRVEPSPARSPTLATRPRYACIAWCWVCGVSPCIGRRLESFMSVLPSWLGGSRFQSGSIV
jgi:hypothetical protein